MNDEEIIAKAQRHIEVFDDTTRLIIQVLSKKN